MIKKSTLIYFTKRVYFAFWWRCQVIKSAILNRKEVDQLVFTFGGRNDNWPTVGRSLYKENAIFRNAILSCNAILTEHGGSEILSYFQDEANPLFFEDESKFTCITAIQLASVDMYNSQDIYPNVVMGVSMGEPAAAYAAGAITRTEALKISLSYMTLYKVESMQYSFVFLNLNFDDATKFCKQCGVWAEIIYEYSSQAVLITCDKLDVDQLKLHFERMAMPFNLAAQKTFIPYHTSKIKPHKAFLFDFYKDIEARPLKCDYYSPTLGKLIPKNTLIEAEYWYDLACVPVRFALTLQTVIDDGYKTFLQIGPPAISQKQFAELTSSINVSVFNSLESENTEISRQESVLNELGKKTFEKSDLLNDEQTTLQNFKQNFSVYGIASTFSMEYLRKYGSVHFLPIHNSWLILGYEEVEHVLKQPASFSSSILKEYDPILLGADPHVHKSVRDLLQPLFSPEVIGQIAKFTEITAKDLLSKLSDRESFDLVKDFSDPLSLYTLCNFFGLCADNAERMLAFTGQDYHNQEYWVRLQEFFDNEFSSCELNNSDCLWQKLRYMVASNEFTLANAASLLRIVWTAGMATTSALISSAVFMILKTPRLANQLLNDDKQTAKFIEECLRLDTPITIVQRITTVQVDLDKQLIPANSTLLLSLKHAMRDPDHYADPKNFLISRPAKRHVAFGAGIHQCIGMGIARAEARSAVKALLSESFNTYTFDFEKPTYTTGSDLVIMTSLRLSKKPQMQSLQNNK